MACSTMSRGTLHLSVDAMAAVLTVHADCRLIFASRDPRGSRMRFLGYALKRVSNGMHGAHYVQCTAPK